jgi:hypothetical protein
MSFHVFPSSFHRYLPGFINFRWFVAVYRVSSIFVGLSLFSWGSIAIFITVSIAVSITVFIAVSITVFIAVSITVFIAVSIVVSIKVYIGSRVSGKNEQKRYQPACY